MDDYKPGDVVDTEAFAFGSCTPLAPFAREPYPFPQEFFDTLAGKALGGQTLNDAEKKVWAYMMEVNEVALYERQILAAQMADDLADEASTAAAAPVEAKVDDENPWVDNVEGGNPYAGTPLTYVEVELGDGRRLMDRAGNFGWAVGDGRAYIAKYRVAAPVVN